jgi:hypothetical protein
MGRNGIEGPEKASVGKIGTGFSDNRKPGRRFDPSHGESQR